MEEKRSERKVTVSGQNMAMVNRGVELVNGRVMEWRRTYSTASLTAGSPAQSGQLKRDRNDVPIVASANTNSNNAGGVGVGGGGGGGGVDRSQGYNNVGQDMTQQSAQYANTPYALTTQTQGQGQGGQGIGGMGNLAQISQGTLQEQQQLLLLQQQQYNQAYAAYTQMQSQMLAQAQAQGQVQGQGQVVGVGGGGQTQSHGQVLGGYAQQQYSQSGQGHGQTGRGY